MSRCDAPAPVDPKAETIGPDCLLWVDDRWRPRPDWFDSRWYREQGLVEGEAGGRGATIYAELDGAPIVLRHYCRGGAVRRLLGDRYLWLGVRASRAWRELALLARLHAAGLPVPPPIAARLRRSRSGSPFYRADLLSGRLPQTRTLAQALTSAPLEPGDWHTVGATIGRFHRAGVDHADLNAHNILLDADGAVYLVDFDRGRLRRSPGRWRRRNLQRLHRSLAKLERLEPQFHFRSEGWDALTRGWHEALQGP